MTRLSIDQVMLGMALALSFRAACQKRQVGCILTDTYKRVLAAGYNGRPRGMPNCYGLETCAEGCEGVHAEINALLTVADTDRIATAYVTHAPCWHCVKALINTNCNEIQFMDASTEDPRAKELWERASGRWIHVQEPSMPNLQASLF